MGMGNYPNSAEVIEEEFVKEICGELLDNLIEYLENHGSDIEGMAISISEYESEIENLDDDENKEVTRLHNLLTAKFEAETGLELHMGFHNGEDRGDEVDGAFWSVEGVYQYSPAGEKYKERITTKAWTVFG